MEKFCKNLGVRLIINLVFLIFGSMQSWAQIPQYFNYNTGPYTDNAPFNTANIHAVLLFLPAEFSTSPSGYINKIYFKAGSSITGSIFYNLMIRMKDTIMSGLPSAACTSPNLQTCLNMSSFTFPAITSGNWVSISLQTPFYHNNTRSLLIDISSTGRTNGFTIQESNIWSGSHIISGTTGSSSCSNNNSYTPSLGFDYTPPLSYNDAGVLSIDSPLVACLSKSQTFKATIKNYGHNQINGVFVNWSVNGFVQFPAYHTSTLDTIGGSGAFSTQVTLGNLTPTVSPMIVRAWTSNPNATTDTVKGNDSAMVSRPGALSGNYTIGGSNPSYTSFATAIAALQSNGVCGNITFNVRSGIYNETIILPPIMGVSSGSTITFKSTANHPDSVVINDSIALPLSLSCSFVNFKNITFNQRATSANVININGSITFDTIYNCKIIAASNATNNNYTLYANGVSLNNVVLRKNICSGSSSGLYLYSSPNWSSNCVIDSNVFQNAYTTPINYFYNTVNLKIKNNNINVNGSGTNGNLNMQYNDSAFEFDGNQIIVANGTTFNVYLAYYNIGNAVNRIKVYNNIFSGGTIYLNIYYFNNYIDIFNNVYNSAGGIDFGAYSNNLRFYHNTINSTANYPIIIRGLGSTGLEIRNNVFSSTGDTYAAYWYTAPGNEICDYNNYYSTGTGLIYNNASSTAFSNMGMWKVVSTKDSASLSYKPAFTSPSNLQPNSADSACWSLNGRGIHSFVGNDIIGNNRPSIRNLGVPDIGAYEFTPASTPPMAIATPAYPSLGTTQSFLFGQDTVAKINWPGSGNIPSTIAVRLYSGSNPPALGAGNYMKTFWDLSSPVNTYNYALSLYYKDPWLGTNPDETNLKLAKYTTSWLSYTATASSVDTIRNIISASGLNNISIFTGTNNNNPLPVKLIYFSGIKDKNDVSLNWATASEMNSKSFEIEKSSDGETFVFIGEVKASINSSQIKSYDYRDNNAFINVREGSIYYRLKMLDLDGNFNYSSIIKIESNIDLVEPPVMVYPNSFSSEIFVKLAPSVNGTVNLVLSDLYGNLIYSKQELINNNLLHMTNMNELRQGVYLLTVRIPSDVFTFKIIKE